jgi:hypothetical protein
MEESYCRPWVIRRSAVQEFENTPGKNATDSAMIINAMDLLHSKRFDIFCLVSSDSDFTRLAKRIRESGADVIGMGYAHTPRAFITVCNTFISIDTLQQANGLSADASSPCPSSHDVSAGMVSTDSTAASLALLDRTIREVAGDDGWSPVTAVGARLMALDPSFDPRRLGASSPGLGKLLRGMSDKYDNKLANHDGGSMCVRPKTG